MQSLCQCLDDVVTNTVVVGLGDSEVLLTVIPDRTADAMLMEYLIDVTNPAQCILRISLVDDTVLSAVERCALLLGIGDSISEEILEELWADFLYLTR